MLVSKPTYGGGAPLGIDLDGGVAKIRIKAKPPVENAPDEANVVVDPEPQPDEADPDPKRN